VNPTEWCTTGGDPSWLLGQAVMACGLGLLLASRSKSRARPGSPGGGREPSGEWTLEGTVAPHVDGARKGPAMFWVWMLGIVAVVTVVAMVVERRRGPSGSSRNVDFNQNNRSGELHDGGISGWLGPGSSRDRDGGGGGGG